MGLPDRHPDRAGMARRQATRRSIGPAAVKSNREHPELDDEQMPPDWRPDPEPGTWSLRAVRAWWTRRRTPAPDSAPPIPRTRVGILMGIDMAGPFLIVHVSRPDSRDGYTLGSRLQVQAVKIGFVREFGADPSANKAGGVVGWSCPWYVHHWRGRADPTKKPST
jgi:hypothetical protein